MISDSFNDNYFYGSATDDFANGDIPEEVLILREGNGQDEGRAMMQLIADVAPGARQAFYAGFSGQADFTEGVLALANDANADVIVDDVTFLNEPMFQDGMISRAIDEVVADGVAYFSSAGNRGRMAYESEFRSSGLLDPYTNADQHDFDPGPGVKTFQQIHVPVGTGFALSLQWDSPFYSASPSSGGATNDVDIVVFNESITLAMNGSVANNLGNDALEIFQFFNFGGYGEEFKISISHFAGDQPGYLKYVMFEFHGGLVDIVDFDNQSGTVFGHTMAQGTMSVGAAGYWNTPEYGVDPAVVQPFSSRIASSTGVVTPLFFDATGTRLVIPEYRSDRLGIVAPDGVNTTFFGGDIDADGFPNFFGTSAAAPHAAAVAALMLSSAGGPGSLTPSQVYSILQSTARDMDDPETVGFDIGFDFATGYGLIDAQAAVQAVALPSLLTNDFPSKRTRVEPEGSLVYRGSKSSEVGFVADQDEYVFLIESGKTISLKLIASSNLRARMSLYRLEGSEPSFSRFLVAESLAENPGEDLVIQVVSTVIDFVETKSPDIWFE